MTFKEATDILIGAPAYSVARLAGVFGKTLNLVTRWRASHGERRNPPAEWPAVVASQADAHADELEAYVPKLRALAASLRGT